MYQVVNYFGLYIATWEYHFRRCKHTLRLVSKGESWLCCVWKCCHPRLPTVVRDCFLKWEWVGEESEPQATSAHEGRFYCYIKDFRYLDLPRRRLRCLVQLVSPFFFFLVGDMARSLWSVKGVIWFLKHQVCYMFPGFGPPPQSQLGWCPNQCSFLPHSLLQPNSGAVIARSFDVGQDCCSTDGCGNSPTTRKKIYGVIYNESP